MFKLKVGKMSAILLILMSVALAVFGQLSLKKGMTEVGKIGVSDLFTSRIFSIIAEKFVFIGLLFYFAASGLWLVVLSQEEVSFAYPLIGLAYVFTAILAKIFFNENVTLFRMLGIFLIIGGAYLIILKI